VQRATPGGDDANSAAVVAELAGAQLFQPPPV